MLTRVFVLAEGAALRRRVKRLVDQPHVLVTSVAPHHDLWRRLAHESIDLVVASRYGLADAAPQTIRSLRELPDHPDVIVLAEEDRPAEAAALLAAGCFAVLDLGLPDDVLASTLAALVQRRFDEALKHPRAVVETRCRLDDFVSTSAAMQKLMATARRVTVADTSVLILGETGVGKERLARAIHAESHRLTGAFVAVNCAAVPETLLESELFGHEKGAFTGAVRARRGYFELAHRGTFFLDEIGDMALPLQAKLLRALQEHRIQPVGSERAIDLDVRILAATSRDLAAEMDAGRFRRDLYYRLSVVTLTLPPLRERRDDIPPLVESYREHFARHLGRPVRAVDPHALRTLIAYDWPGNVRELINVMEHAVLLCAGETITVSDLPDISFGARVSERDEPADFLGWGARGGELTSKPWRTVRSEALDRLERHYLEELLRVTGGHVGETARRAGMDPRSLFQKMRRHGLRKEDYRLPAGAAVGPDES